MIRRTVTSDAANGRAPSATAALPHQITPLLRHLGQLRPARAEHRRLLRPPDGERDPWGRPLDETAVLVLKVWSYAGTGHTVAPDAELALASAARARAHGQASTPSESVSS